MKKICKKCKKHEIGMHLQNFCWKCFALTEEEEVWRIQNLGKEISREPNLNDEFVKLLETLQTNEQIENAWTFRVYVEKIIKTLKPL